MAWNALPHVNIRTKRHERTADDQDSHHPCRTQRVAHSRRLGGDPMVIGINEVKQRLLDQAIGVQVLTSLVENRGLVT